jgi:hypothetical protein
MRAVSGDTNAPGQPRQFHWTVQGSVCPNVVSMAVSADYAEVPEVSNLP